MAVGGGDEALAWCEKHEGTLQVMLSDIGMRNTDGQDLSAYIASRYPKAKVLYMSGFPFQELAHRGLVADPSFVLQKPFRCADLLHRICRVLHPDEGEKLV